MKRLAAAVALGSLCFTAPANAGVLAWPFTVRLFERTGTPTRIVFNAATRSSEYPETCAELVVKVRDPGAMWTLFGRRDVTGLEHRQALRRLEEAHASGTTIYLGLLIPEYAEAREEGFCTLEPRALSVLAEDHSSPQIVLLHWHLAARNALPWAR